VAVDDMMGDNYQGLTDHIFDEVRSVRIGVKTGMCVGGSDTPTNESEVIDDVCWDTLVSWLAPATASPGAESTPAFFLPCSDKDVRLLAHKKHTILAKLTAATALASNGGGTTEIINQECIACSRILCPTLEAVASCQKPQIAAVSGMGCFIVPAYLLLTAEVCLSEVQSFCEVEYPVMFKVRGCEVIMLCDICICWSCYTTRCCGAIIYYYYLLHMCRDHNADVVFRVPKMEPKCVFLGVK
jgi:hypothetical protein